MKHFCKKYKFRKIDILIIIFAIIFCFSLYTLVKYYVNIYVSERKYQDIKNEYMVNEDSKELKKIQVNFEELLNINSDVKGWISFNHGKVNYPFVQSKDMNFYLKHSFDKKNNSIGSIFLDYRNESFQDPNIILYGHNTIKNTMFGSLEDVFKKNFFDDDSNHFIQVLDLENNYYIYEIFSFYVVNAENYYITTDFKNNFEFNKYLKVIKERSYKKFDIDVTPEDKILTLSTCNGRGISKRTVIHAKLIEIDR